MYLKRCCCQCNKATEHHSRTLHHPRSPNPPFSCAGSAESARTPRRSERRMLTKCAGNYNAYTSHRYTHLMHPKTPTNLPPNVKKKQPKTSLTGVADSNLHNGKSLKRSLSNTKTDENNHNGTLPEYLHPGCSERPLMALLPHTSQPEVHVHIYLLVHQLISKQK